MKSEEESSSQGKGCNTTKQPKVNEEDLRFIIKNIEKDQLNSFARALGLDDQDIEEIEYDNAHKGLAEIRHKIASRFRQIVGEEATMQRVAVALETIGRKDLLEVVLPSGKSTVLLSEQHYDECLQKLQSCLSKRYRHLQLPRESLFKDKLLLLEELYVDLTMKLKDLFGRYEEESTLQLHEIFESVNKNVPRRIMIESDPGYGKTTLGLKLATDWSNGEAYIRDKFLLLFNVSLKKFTGDLNKILLDQMREVDEIIDTETKLEIIKRTKNKVLLILDGFDELDESLKSKLFPLLNGNVYPLMTVILTTNSGEIHFDYETEPNDHLFESGAKSNLTSSLSFLDKRIQIKGISQEKKTEFVLKYLGHREKKTYKMYEHLITDRSREFYYSPLFLILFVVLVEDKTIQNIKNRTDFLMKVFNYLTKRALMKSKEIDRRDKIDIFDEEDPNSILHRSLLLQFGKLALSKLNQNERSFTRDEILRKCNNDHRIFHFGILVRKTKYENHRLSTEYEVLHRFVLEFMAAFYIADQFRQKLKISENFFKTRSIFNSLMTEKLLYESHSLLIPFLVGLMKSDAHVLFEFICKDFPVSHLTNIHIEMETTRENMLAILPFHLNYILKLFIVFLFLNYPLDYSFALACILYFVFFLLIHC